MMRMKMNGLGDRIQQMVNGVTTDYVLDINYVGYGSIAAGQGYKLDASARTP